jgi:hypothetical protein
MYIGEHKSNPNEDRSLKTLVQLAGYAREVFGSQPDRRFVPGFTICGSVMRLWVFDKEGLDDGGRVIKRSKLAGSSTEVVNTDVEERELDIGDAHSIKVAEIDSLAGCDSETYGNRIHCCVVSSPARRPLHAYRSIRELLEALRDAIKGHKSLLEDGKILHRDVSENNIIIVERPAEGDPKGRLIDLDLAKELGSIPNGASHRTGTM